MIRMTKAQRKVLERAAARENGWLCPTPGLHAAAQAAVIESLKKRGWAEGCGAPRITDVGRAALTTGQ